VHAEANGGQKPNSTMSLESPQNPFSFETTHRDVGVAV